MCSLPVFVGMDYHDSSVRVFVQDTDGSEMANADRANDWKAIADFGDRFGRPVRAAIESCCGGCRFGRGVGELRGLVGGSRSSRLCPAHETEPGQNGLSGRPVAGGFGAGRLSAAGVVGAALHSRVALLREQRCHAPAGLNAWTKAWQQWVRQTAELSAQGRWLAKQHLRELARLATRIRQVEKRLEHMTANDVEVQRLQQQPGIGPVTAWTIRAEIGHFDRFRTGKQLARFCGLSPRNASSGQRQADAGLIRAANPALRTVLIEAAHRLIQYDPSWQKFAQRLRARGKPGSVVAAAVANRWIRRLYHEMKTPSGELAAAVGPAR
jgi:transposase